MADVISVPGLGEQLGLIVRLRWWLFRNGLRARSEKLGLVGSGIITLFTAGFALGIGAAIGFGSFALVSEGKVDWLSAIFWAIFLLWHVFPVFMVEFGSGFDFRSLLRFPIRLSAYGILNLAQGVADSFGICGIFWHGCLWLGVILARPDAWIDTTIVIGFSIGMNLLFGRMIIAWTERLMAQRRTREIAVAVFVLLMVSLQFARFAIQNAAGPVAAFFHRTHALWELLPPGQTGAALRDELLGQTGAMFREWGGVVGYAVLFAALLFQRLRAEYLGELISESVAPARVPKSARALSSPAADESSPVGWLSGPVSAVFRKEIRYLMRNSIQAVSLLMPVIIAGAFSMNQGPRAHFMHQRFEGYAYTAIVAYAALIVMTRFAMNSFAYDGGGIQLFFLAPVSFSQVMLGKNLFQWSVLAIEAVLAWVLITLIARPPEPIVLAVTWTGLVFVALANASLGNWLSLRFPQKLVVGTRMRNASGIPVLLSMVAIVACGVLLAIVFWLATMIAGPWLVPVVFAGLDVAALLGYRALLETNGSLALGRQEVLIEKLVR